MFSSSAPFSQLFLKVASRSKVVPRQPWQLMFEKSEQRFPFTRARAESVAFACDISICIAHTTYILR